MNKYQYKGRLFRDSKCCSYTLYLNITDPETQQILPEIRIGYKDNGTNTQYKQTQAIANGQCVTGISANISQHTKTNNELVYKIYIRLNGVEDQIEWLANTQQKGMVASSDTQNINDFWQKQTTLTKFLKNLDNDSDYPTHNQTRNKHNNTCV